MKKFYLLTKTLLVAALLMVGANAWADATTLYEKGTTGHEWGEGDLAGWSFSGSDGQEINASGYLRFYKNTVARTEYTSTHSLTTTADYVVTMNLLWNVENANGSSTAGCYVKFGDVTLFWCGQDRNLKITIGSTETALISGAATTLRGTDFNVEISINKKTKAVSYSISNSLYNSGTPITGSGSSVTGEVTNVIFGWWRGGQQNASSQIVKNIVITEEPYSVPTADYTVHFVDNNSVTVKADEIRNGEVGSAVGADAGDKTAFVAEGNKYVYSSDGGGTTVTNDGSAEFTVTYTKYVSTSYAVKAQVSGEDLETLASGTAYLDGSTTEYWSKYINVEDKWYVADDETYGVAITAANTNVAFTATDAIDYFFEAEDMTYSRVFNEYGGTAASNGSAKTLYGNANAVTTTTVPAGVYTISLNGIKWQDGYADNYQIAYSVDGTNWVALGNIAYADGEGGVKTLVGAIIPCAAYIRILTTLGVQTPRRYLDYMALKKTADLPSTEKIVVTSAGYATYVSNYNLDFTSAATKAYKVSVESAGVATMTLVDEVPAKTPVLLYVAGGNGEGEAIPVTTEAVSAVSGNNLIAGTGAAVATDDGDYTNMILNNGEDGIGFYFAAGQTVATNRAYLHIADALAPASGSARGMSLVIDDEKITGINEAEAATEATQKEGKFVVDGKLVIFKKGMKFNANGQLVK